MLNEVTKLLTLVLDSIVHNILETYQPYSPEGGGQATAGYYPNKASLE
jgi:hypothetical protein